jgi:hypothetical protein
MPSSVAETILVGVGNPGRGIFIDGHQSRQDNAELVQLARRLGGHYHDGNAKQVPGALLRRLTAPDAQTDRFHLSLRTLAVLVLAISAGVLCVLPLLLEYIGSFWKPAPIRTGANGGFGEKANPLVAHSGGGVERLPNASGVKA